MGWGVGEVKVPLPCPSGAQPLSGPQVLLVQYKGTGNYYAIKALKKQEVLSRDEVERCVLAPWRAPRMAGLGCWYQRAAGGSWGPARSGFSF